MTDDVIPDMPGVVKWAQEAIRGYCGWHVAPVITQTLTLSGDGSNVVILPSLRVKDVTEITVGGNPVTFFRWIPSGVLYLPFRVPAGFLGAGQIQVTLVHGYDDVPDALVQAASRVAASPAYSTMTVDGVTVSGGSLFGSGSFSDEVLAPYRLPALP